MITGSKLILVRISLQKVDLGEDYTQKDTLSKSSEKLQKTLLHMGHFFNCITRGQLHSFKKINLLQDACMVKP